MDKEDKEYVNTDHCPSCGEKGSLIESAFLEDGEWIKCIKCNKLGCNWWG